MAEIKGALEYAEKRDYALIEQAIRSPRLTVPTLVMLFASASAIALGVFHIYVAGFGTPESHSFRFRATCSTMSRNSRRAKAFSIPATSIWAGC